MPDTEHDRAPQDDFFLRSERLGFRCWSSADQEFALGLRGDLEMTRLIGGPFTRDEVEERLGNPDDGVARDT